jgi:hypothetical protein
MFPICFWGELVPRDVFIVPATIAVMAALAVMASLAVMTALAVMADVDARGGFESRIRRKL